MVTVEAGARLHFGFQNLSLAHERLYGGVGVALDEPGLVLEIERSDRLRCPDDEVRPYARRAVDALSDAPHTVVRDSLPPECHRPPVSWAVLPIFRRGAENNHARSYQVGFEAEEPTQDLAGARVTVRKRFDRHVGLGSGTQLALSCLSGIARAYGLRVDPRARAPDLGRGGRSGVGVATFERGGFVIDSGHPAERFTSQLPETGSWDVPQPIVRRSLPDSWRFVLVTPTGDVGRNGESENESMQSVVERADPGIADDISTLLTRQLLPAVAQEDVATFGRAVSRLGRLNGAWYADEQGGVYRPPVAPIVETLSDSDSIVGSGQSSWGPTVYGITTASDADDALEAAEHALAVTGVDGTVRITKPRNSGATVEW